MHESSEITDIVFQVLDSLMTCISYLRIVDHIAVYKPVLRLLAICVTCI